MSKEKTQCSQKPDSSSLPEKPGVYLFYDSKGELLYIGKANNLRRRIKDHLKSKSGWKEEIAEIDFILVADESQALIEEQTLVARHRPRYNILLRDNKAYPSIAISWDEEYPRIFLTREKHKKGRKYFGPYTKSREAREIVSSLQKIIPFRSCQGKEPGRIQNPCLDYHLGLCKAPCISAQTKKEYRAEIKKIENILSGKTEETRVFLEKKMQKAAADKEYEKAALLRDRIDLLQKIKNPVKVSGDLDVVVCTKDLISISKIRDGGLLGSETISLSPGLGDPIESFLFQYYKSPPKEVLIENVSERAKEAWSQKHPHSKLYTPHLGPKKDLLEKCRQSIKWKKPKENPSGIEELSSFLGQEIEIIEGYDVSNISGDHAYVSMVVFRSGRPDYKSYRVFKIEREGPDDYASLREALSRRALSWKKQTPGFDQKPDLILIDGGLGQLSSATKALSEFIDEEQILSLAKKREQVFQKGKELTLAADDPEVLLLRRVRDEAHRFALKHHKKARSRAMLMDPLEQIPGVGKTRARAIRREISNPEEASLEDLAAVSGISFSLAEKIYRSLNRR